MFAHPSQPSLPAGELERIATCSWTSDTQEIVLEVTESNSKSSTDAEKCSWRDLLHELEEEGCVDATINGHEVDRPSPGGDAESTKDSSGLSSDTCSLRLTGMGVTQALIFSS